MSKQRSFDVFLAGKKIDTVFATDYSAEEMLKSLIDHDGYDPRISVYRRSIEGQPLIHASAGSYPAYDQASPEPTSKA
jgi:hypothetical protein